MQPILHSSYIYLLSYICRCTFHCRVYVNVQPASAGGSSAGRRTIRLLQTLLDHYAATPLSADSRGVLGDVISSQRTPIRFTSLLSVFR